MVVVEREVIGKILVAMQVGAEGDQVDDALDLAGGGSGFQRGGGIEKFVDTVLLEIEEIAEQAAVAAKGGEVHRLLQHAGGKAPAFGMPADGGQVIAADRRDETPAIDNGTACLRLHRLALPRSARATRRGGFFSPLSAARL